MTTATQKEKPLIPIKESELKAYDNIISSFGDPSKVTFQDNITTKDIAAAIVKKYGVGRSAIIAQRIFTLEQEISKAANASRDNNHYPIVKRS